MEVAQPFALQLMTDSTHTANSILDEIGRQAAQVSNTALSLPRRIDDTIDKLDRGDIRIRVRSLESERALRQLSAMQRATNYTLFVGMFVVSATLLFINGYWKIAGVVIVLALIPLGAYFRLIRRIDRLDRML
jgi:hypothetical protein